LDTVLSDVKLPSCLPIKSIRFTLSSVSSANKLDQQIKKAVHLHQRLCLPIEAYQLKLQLRPVLIESTVQKSQCNDQQIPSTQHTLMQKRHLRVLEVKMENEVVSNYIKATIA
jgi:hypothetical protein